MPLYYNQMEFEGRTPLVEAVKTDNLKHVKLLLVRGADPNQMDKEGRLALVEAVKINSRVVLEILLYYNADLNAQDSNGDTAIHQASKLHNTRMLERLLELGARVDTQDKEKRTPLHDLVGNGTLENINTFLERGANPSMRDKRGRNALHEAAVRHPTIIGYDTGKRLGHISGLEMTHLPSHFRDTHVDVEQVNKIRVLINALDRRITEEYKEEMKAFYSRRPLAGLRHFGMEIDPFHMLNIESYNVIFIDILVCRPTLAEKIIYLYDIDKQASHEGNESNRVMSYIRDIVNHSEAALAMWKGYNVGGKKVSQKSKEFLEDYMKVTQARKEFLEETYNEYKTNIIAVSKSEFIDCLDAMMAHHLWEHFAEFEEARSGIPLILKSGENLASSEKTEPGGLQDSREIGYDMEGEMTQRLKDFRQTFNEELISEKLTFDDVLKYQPIIAQKLVHLHVLAGKSSEEGIIPYVNHLVTTSEIALEIAESYRESRVVQTLVEHGAEINQQDNEDLTPLMLAMMEGKYECIRILLNKGCSIDLKDRNGMTARDHAKDKHCIEIFQKYHLCTLMDQARGKCEISFKFLSFIRVIHFYRWRQQIKMQFSYLHFKHPYILT